jgi:hypothetical protein
MRFNYNHAHIFIYQHKKLRTVGALACVLYNSKKSKLDIVETGFYGIVGYTFPTISIVYCGSKMLLPYLK